MIHLGLNIPGFLDASHSFSLCSVCVGIAKSSTVVRLAFIGPRRWDLWAPVSAIAALGSGRSSGTSKSSLGFQTER
jgi:hypothetical protein